MPDHNSESPEDPERKLGVNLFNHVWSLIEKKNRTSAEDEEMIHAAHASLYHWSKSKTGTPANSSISEWQVSHVYSLLNRQEPALYHAQRCLKVTEENRLGDWYLAYAYEAMTRAYAVSGKKSQALKYLRLAEKAGSEIKEKREREHFLGDLKELKSMFEQGGD